VSDATTAGSSRVESVTERACGVGGWRNEVEEAQREGWRFAGLWASRVSDRLELRTALTRDSGFLLLSCASEDGRFQSIVDLVPGADWDEREAHDLYDAQLPARAALRPLVDHTDDLSAWTVPVRGHDPFQVAVGPIHAGVIESGHFRCHVVGERILHLDLRLFYKHRGLERAAEGRMPEQALPFLQRACAADAVTNAIAFAQACEAAQGLWPAAGLRRARTLLLELERLYNHLNDIAAICAGVGFAAGNMIFAALKERTQRLNQRVAGHRFLFDTVRVGHSELRVSRADASELRAALRELRRDSDTAWRELQFVGSAQERFEQVGVLSADDALLLGATGPTARAAGLAIDARSHSPRLWYSGFSPAVPPAATGDVAARMEMRAAELAFSFDCLDELLAKSLLPAQAQSDRAPAAHGVSVVESPRGQTLCAVRLDDGAVHRVHLRTGSYANWPVLAHVVRDSLLPDFPLINKSFELCYACADR